MIILCKVYQVTVIHDDKRSLLHDINILSFSQFSLNKMEGSTEQSKGGEVFSVRMRSTNKDSVSQARDENSCGCEDCSSVLFTAFISVSLSVSLLFPSIYTILRSETPPNTSLFISHLKTRKSGCNLLSPQPIIAKQTEL